MPPRKQQRYSPYTPFSERNLALLLPRPSFFNDRKESNSEQTGRFIDYLVSVKEKPTEVKDLMTIHCGRMEGIPASKQMVLLNLIQEVHPALLTFAPVLVSKCSDFAREGKNLLFHITHSILFQRIPCRAYIPSRLWADQYKYTFGSTVVYDELVICPFLKKVGVLQAGLVQGYLAMASAANDYLLTSLKAKAVATNTMYPEINTKVNSKNLAHLALFDDDGGMFRFLLDLLAIEPVLVTKWLKEHSELFNIMLLSKYLMPGQSNNVLDEALPKLVTSSWQWVAEIGYRIRDPFQCKSIVPTVNMCTLNELTDQKLLQQSVQRLLHSHCDFTKPFQFSISIDNTPCSVAFWIKALLVKLLEPEQGIFQLMNGFYTLGNFSVIDYTKFGCSRLQFEDFLKFYFSIALRFQVNLGVRFSSYTVNRLFSLVSQTACCWIFAQELDQPMVTETLKLLDLPWIEVKKHLPVEHPAPTVIYAIHAIINYKLNFSSKTFGSQISSPI